MEAPTKTFKLRCAAVNGGQLVRVKLPIHARVGDVKRAIVAQLGSGEGDDVELCLAKDDRGTWLKEKDPAYQQLKGGKGAISERIKTMKSSRMHHDTFLSKIAFPGRGGGRIDILFDVSKREPTSPRDHRHETYAISWGYTTCAIVVCASLVCGAVVPCFTFPMSAVVWGVVMGSAQYLCKHAERSGCC